MKLRIAWLLLPCVAGTMFLSHPLSRPFAIAFALSCALTLVGVARKRQAMGVEKPN